LNNIKQFFGTHLFYLVIIAIGIVAFHAWSQEHDARLAAEATIKTSQVTIATLQQQIQQTNTQAAAKVRTIVKIVHDLGPAPTTGQIVAAVPQITDAPLNARVITNDPTNISVAAQPFLQFVEQATTDKVNLGACQSDLNNETAIAAQKDVQIAALKKKPSLIHRITGVAKAVGIGVGVGLLLGGHL